MVCLNHPETEAVARCGACGKPLCEKCVLKSNGGNYCSEACAAKAKASASRSGDVMERAGKADSKAAVKKLIVVIILLAIAGAAAYFYSQNKKEIDDKVSSQVKTIRKESKKAIDAGHKALDKESKYKRDRENLVK